MLLLYPVPSVWIGVVEVSLRWWFPDEPDGFFSVFTDLCNDVKYIFIFVIGFGITAADDQGMKEIIRKGRWYYLCFGNMSMQIIVHGVVYDPWTFIVTNPACFSKIL